MLGHHWPKIGAPMANFFWIRTCALKRNPNVGNCYVFYFTAQRNQMVFAKNFTDVLIIKVYLNYVY